LSNKAIYLATSVMLHCTVQWRV